jgi:hypothetical protein
VLNVFEKNLILFVSAHYKPTLHEAQIKLFSNAVHCTKQVGVWNKI